ncbi:hypothetical protein MBLNU230_g3772t1 [Neophaeotheca triangularis]
MSFLSKRQTYDDDYYGGYSWWWTDEGVATRYAIIGILFGSLLLFILLSWFHAHRRIKRGLPPLRYHNWMVRRQHRAHYPSRYQNPPTSYPLHPTSARPYYAPDQNRGYYAAEPNPDSQNFATQDHPPAPPAYGAWEQTPPPPSYQPTKVAADQVFVRETGAGEGSGSAVQPADAGPVMPPPSAVGGRP